MNKRTIISLAVIVIIFVVGFVVLQTPRGPVLILENKKIMLEIADSDQERQQGLSHRPMLPENTGLLFVFQQEGTWGFWMKDMNFAIDMIWLDKDFRVVHVQDNVAPDTYPTTYSPEQPALYVLEVNAGIADAYGIEINDILDITL